MTVQTTHTRSIYNLLHLCPSTDQKKKKNLALWIFEIMNKNDCYIQSYYLCLSMWSLKNNDISSSLCEETVTQIDQKWQITAP